MTVAPDRARLFFALWPDPSVSSALAQIAIQARAECGGRAIPLQKIHLTVVFVGAVERSRIANVQSCAAALAIEPFELELSTLGYWRHNRIVWAGATSCPRALAALVAALSHELAGLGIHSEDRPYVPHVTLVRNARCPPRELHMDPLQWRARELVLVESVTGASRYEVLARWPLV
ncbi:MAG TPA: RNA 2',3'-cyclic phosphodiesterase [Burkholderiales bacterium]|nr:RNA 2',3'-cyclic phosphodiesterase [Burkholderiales bacterium]